MLIVYRSIEFLVLFVALPVAIAMMRRVISPIPVLIGVSVVALIALYRDPTFDRSLLWNVSSLTTHFPRIVILWAVVSFAVGLAVFLIQPDYLFAFPRDNLRVWILVMLLYPIFSVIPQSIIYRAFFCHRYSVLFGQGVLLIVMAAFAFGLAHLVFRHWLPVAITLAGGALLVWRYRSSGSMLTSALEHAMYGDMLFTLGLGMFFYHGSQRIVERITSATTVPLQ
jgi:hypothetical protein